MDKLVIESEHIKIRKLKISDLSDFYFYRSNPEVTKYQGFDTYTIDQSKEFIESQLSVQFGKAGEWNQLGIENKQTGKLIGDCAIKLGEYDVRIAEVGITISHMEQNKGYGKESLVAILNFLFSIMDFHRVTEIVDVENVASIRLLESVGFVKEGHFIQNIFFNGKWGSEFQYAMLKNQWELITAMKS